MRANLEDPSQIQKIVGEVMKKYGAHFAGGGEIDPKSAKEFFDDPGTNFGGESDFRFGGESDFGFGGEEESNWWEH